MSKLYRMLAVTLFMLIALMYSCDDENIDDIIEKINVEGTLVNEDGEPIEGALIEAFQLIEGEEERTLFDSDKTDKNGQVKIDEVPATFDGISIRVTHEEYVTIDKSLKEFEIDSVSPSFNLVMKRKANCVGTAKFLVSDNDKNPLEGVKIELKEGSTDLDELMTDDEGMVNFEKLCEGLYTYKISKDGFKSKLAEFDLDSNNMNFEREIILDIEDPEDSTCCDGNILIKLTDEDGNIIDDATVMLIDEEGNKVDEKSSKDGMAFFEDLCRGLYTIVIEREGFETLEFTVPSDCDDIELLKKMKEDKECCEAELCIVVRGDKNFSEILADASVNLSKNGKQVTSGTTVGDTLCFKDLCEGEYFIEIKHKEYFTQNFSIDISCDSTTVIERKLFGEEDSCCTGKIFVKALDKSSGKAQDAKVIVRGWDYEKDGNTGDNGTWFEELCEGKYTIEIKKEGFASIMKEVEVKCDSTYEFEEFMEKDSCCNGRVVIYPFKEGTDDLIDGAKVVLWKNGKAIADPRVKGEPIVFKDLCEGNYAISIDHESFEGIEFEFTIKCDDDLEFKKFMKMKKDSCCEGVLKVFVSDKKTEDAVNGATVIVKGKDGKVIEDGKSKDGKPVVFDGLCEGKYTVVVEVEGYGRYEETVEIGCNEKKELAAKLEKDDCCDGVLSIFAKDEKTSEAIKDAVIILKNKEGKVVGEGNSKDGKTVVFEELCEGKYTVIIEAEGYERFQESYEIECDDEKVVTVKMKDDCCDGVVWVNAKDKKTQDILNGAQVEMYKDGKLIEEGYIKDDKAVGFDGLCKGKHTFLIKKDGYQTYEFHVEIECGDEKEFMKEMESDDCCDNKIEIEVQDKDTKELIKNATIKLWKDGKLQHEKIAKDGRIVFEELCKGKYGVDIIHEDYENIEFNFEVDCKEDKKFEKELVKDDCCDGRLEFIVKDEKTKEYLKNAKIKLWKDGKVVKDGYTDGDGKLVFEEVCKGNYDIDITHDDYEGIEFSKEMGCKDNIKFEKMLKPSDCCDARLELILKDENDDPIEGVDVKLYKGDDKIALKKTDKDGKVVFEEVCKGDNYSFHAFKTGYDDIEFEFEVDCKDNLKWTKTLESDECCTASLKLIVKDKDSKEALDSADIEIKYDGKKVISGTTDKDGKRVFTKLCNKKYDIIITRKGYATKEFEFEFKKCEALQETIYLEK